MIELGKKQKLLVVKTVDFGIYLGEDRNAPQNERVLLPSKQVPEGTKVGDEIEVFIYKDSQDRLIATTREPMLQVGQTAVLKVKQVTRIGAFLDWGLEKDLLLPYHEQTNRVREGEECLVALYVDKSSRLCATMKVYHYLSTRTPYVPGDMVKGRVYEISGNFGVFVAVDDKYSALIPAREATGKYRPGAILDLRVTEVKEDGKMNVSDRQKAYIQINEDAESVLSVIEELINTMTLFKNRKNYPDMQAASLSMSDPMEILQDIRRCCGGEKRRQIDQITNLIAVMQMIKIMNEEPSGGENP